MDDYQRKGVASEIVLFVNKVKGYPILSDTQLTPSGEALWQSLLRSGKFKEQILYIPTSERFSLTDAGRNTKDGRTVILPHDDNFHSEFWDGEKGQCFFYLIESEGNFIVESDGRKYCYGVDRSKHGLGLMFPPQYFTDGDH
jgi:hypothetical protein